MPEVHHGDAYYANSDIDWFCQINGVNIHVASMGHALPKGVEQTLHVVYEQVSKIEMVKWGGKESLWYNEELLREVVKIEGNQAMARYLATFVVMARKGFYSFAPLTTDPTDNDYYLVAKPVSYKFNEIEGIFSKQIPEFDLSKIDSITAIPLVEMIER